MESYKAYGRRGQENREVKFSEMTYDHLENALAYFIRKRNDAMEKPLDDEEDHFKRLMRLSLIISMITKELTKREDQYAK